VHHRFDARLERAGRAVGLEFVVLDKIMPPSARMCTSATVSCGPKPTRGLMIVPTRGRFSTVARRRMLEMPNFGPG